MFGANNQVKQQRQMIENEMQFQREQEATQQANLGDEMYMLQQDKKEDLTRWQQDIKDDIEITIHDLKREIMNEEGEWVAQTVFTGEYNNEGKAIYKKLPPMINDIGINMIRSKLRPLTSRNLMMSNYGEERILIKLKRIIFTLVANLTYYQPYYGVEKGNLANIVDLFKDLAEPAHWRCLNNGERSYLNTINKRVEAHTSTDGMNQQQRKGFFGNMIG